MRRFSCILLTLTSISSICTAQTWVFEWRNQGPDSATIEKGSEPQPCKAINHTEGYQFSWDAHGGPWCLDLYKDRDCKDGIGRACQPYPWDKAASQNILAFDVQSSSPSSTSIQTTTATTSTATASSETTTAASGGGGSSLSGGAIAGIVVGVVVGVGIIAGLAFFLGMRRRKQKKSAIAEESIPPSPGHAETPPMDKPEPLEQPVNGETQHHHRLPPGSRVVELPGHNTTPELSDNNRVVELDTPHTDVKPPIQH